MGIQCGHGVLVYVVSHDHIEFQSSSHFMYALNEATTLQPTKQKTEENHYKFTLFSNVIIEQSYNVHMLPAILTSFAHYLYDEPV